MKRHQPTPEPTHTSSPDLNKLKKALAQLANRSDEYFDYLDNLRESGVTNMFGAAAYLSRDFDLAPEDAQRILVYWMETFESRSSARQSPPDAVRQHRGGGR